MNKMPKANPYKPVYSIKRSTQKAKQVQRATQKLSVENVRELCRKMGFLPTVPQLAALQEYLFLLQKWNQSMNLVGKNTWEDILTELAADSLHLAKYLNSHPVFAPSGVPFFAQEEKLYSFACYENEQNFSAWDLGAGAGLPGIPLRILWNQGEYTMVEAREKRSLFLNMACTKLGLENTFVCRDRAENFMEEELQENRKAKLIVSRAFMPYEKMLPFVAPYLASGSDNGSIIFLTLEKIDASKYNSQEFQWNTKNIYEYSIKGKKRFFCEIEKLSNS